MPARKPASVPVTSEVPEQGTEKDGTAAETGEVTSAPGAAPAEPPEPPLAPSPFYIATRPLFVGGNAGAMPVRAFNPEDRVPADLVEPNGWTASVRHPSDNPDPAPADTSAEVTGQEPADDDAR